MAGGYKPFIPDTLLEVQGDHETGSHEFVFENYSLKLGVTTRCYETSQEENFSKLGPEYDVVVVEQKSDGGATSSIYRNCLALDSIGGLADFFEFKRRTPSEGQYESDLEEDKHDGNVVMVLCTDGNSEKALIVGGLKHPARKEVLTKDKGIHMEFEYNGLNMQSNKDGELKILFRSATDNKGKPQDSSAGGAFLQFKKDGSIELNDGETEKILIDKTGKKIDISANSDISVRSGANVNVSADANVDIKSAADLLADAGGNAMLRAAADFKIEAGTKATIKGKIVKIEADNAAFVKANNIFIQGQFVAIANGASPALVITTKFLGVGNLGMPVISIPMGPFSSSTFLGI